MLKPAPIYDLVAEKTGKFTHRWALWLQNLVSDLNSSVKVLAQSAVAASHTGDTDETTLATVIVPAKSMGSNGGLIITTLWTYSENVNVKRPRIDFGGESLLSTTQSGASNESFRDQRQIWNRNSASSQIGGNTGSTVWGSSGAAPFTASVDTTADVEITFTGQLTDSADTITLESYLVELIRN